LYFCESGSSQIRKITLDGIIHHVAGNGGGFAGDGGPAANAQFAFPQGIAFDSKGNLYIADQSNNRVRKIDTKGNISTVAGNGTPGFAGDGGPAISASLTFPTGVAIDGSGNLYIADSINNCVRKVTPAGMISTVAGVSFSGISAKALKVFSTREGDTNFKWMVEVFTAVAVVNRPLVVDEPPEFNQLPNMEVEESIHEYRSFGEFSGNRQSA